MAKRKEDAPAPGSPAWMATFADLMNLLLCFFVLLFAMSNVDEGKQQELIASFSGSIGGLFEGGSTSIIEGSLISAGVSNLSDLSDFYQNLGLNAEGEGSSPSEDLYDYSGEEIIEVLNDKGKEASEEIAENIETLAKQYFISEQIDIEFTSQYVMITLNGALLFDSAEVQIIKKSLPLVDKVGDILRNYSSNMIEIIGYTDNVPLYGHLKYDDNWDLSTGRAKSVMVYLAKNKGIDMTNMKASGRGENDPIASNDTAEGRAQNRRVEIKIFNEYSIEQ